MMEVRNVVLKRGKEQSLERFHPWVFSGAIEQKPPTLGDGDWVRLTNSKGETLAYGHYQDGSIAIRILSFGASLPGERFWYSRISRAASTRRSAGLPSSETNCYRLVHAEGDGLPGLIVDVYNDVAVVQAHSYGMHRDRHAIGEAVREVLGESCKAIYYRAQITLPGKKSTFENEYLFGSSTVPQQVSEHGCRFYINWEEGQKTGFFLDQRENRKLLQSFSNGKKILNTFCYTGGFSISALVAGAQLVHSVDASAKAIALTEENLRLNAFDPLFHRCFAVDTFEFLSRKETDYDVIILDPPAFAKHRDARHQAVKGYQRLNTEAMKVIKSGGILFTFSCSQVVDRQLFYNTIVSSAIQAGRQIKVLSHLSQPADHPVSIFHPEGEYLKGLILFVE